MPELPDIVLYRDALAARVTGAPLLQVRIDNPFVLRTAIPPIAEAEGKRVREVRRMGKRIVLALEGDLFLVFHLMIAGRLRWLGAGGAPPKRITLARLVFPPGMLAFTEAGTKRRASLHLVRGDAALAAMDPGGLEALGADARSFAARLTRENHTLKRALTDPRLFSGIGNAYSDEILHRARLSPLALTQKLSADDVTRLHDATRDVLIEWTERLRHELAGAFPGNVTAFRPEMAVHGKYRRALPGLRRAGATDRLCRERVQLLRALPDRRQAPRRPIAVATPEGQLAEVDRRTRLELASRSQSFDVHTMPSFDIISEVNTVEVRNALDQANKELSTRFDFKGSDARAELADKTLTLFADDDFKMKQVIDVVVGKLTKRGVDIRALKYGDIEKISGNKVKQVVTIRVGVEQELAKKIVKLVKESKMKVQASIQGDTVRISGAKRDDLQAAIALVKKSITDFPLQYDNFRD